MGRVYKYGDNIDTDVIIPGRYLSLSSPEDLARVCMEGVDPGFAKSVRQGDIIVGGKNFGSGSSREHAAHSILASGVACVVAESFARIFYRNAINLGLPVLESPEAACAANAGDEMEVAIAEGVIENKTKGESYRFTPFPDFALEIMECGGVKAWIRKHESEERNQ